MSNVTIRKAGLADLGAVIELLADTDALHREALPWLFQRTEGASSPRHWNTLGRSGSGMGEGGWGNSHGAKRLRVQRAGARFLGVLRLRDGIAASRAARVRTRCRSGFARRFALGAALVG